MNPQHFLCSADTAPAVPITPLRKDALKDWLASQPETTARWVHGSRFAADTGEMCLIPDRSGGLDRVLLGRGDAPSAWDWSILPTALPARVFRIDAPLDAEAGAAAARAWALACYRFDRYRAATGACATLALPPAVDAAAISRAVAAVFLARDLINTPAADMGPPELAAAVRDIGSRFGATVTVIEGEDLAARSYPLVHAVGRASTRLPCLIDLRWGAPDAPRLTLVGKGVCFDSGGLDIKPSSAMKLMKKDMGGAAILLGLAQMVMAAALPIRLRLLIPAVENSVSGNALRPLDVIRSRKGTTVEIGNTDAEGRLVLADALTEAASEAPALVIDCATLTGAARVALGTELPALFCNDDALAADLLACGERVGDSLWRLPLWQPYRRHLRGKIADLTNAPDLAFAGAITAALFLAEFVPAAQPWIHLDVMAWNTAAQPGRPEGGEAMGLLALAALVEQRFRS
ncbi:MAG: leucyl aminopeptidase family protein [Defluviicoccus sp.]